MGFNFFAMSTADRQRNAIRAIPHARSMTVDASGILRIPLDKAVSLAPGRFTENASGYRPARVPTLAGCSPEHGVARLGGYHDGGGT